MLSLSPLQQRSALALACLLAVVPAAAARAQTPVTPASTGARTHDQAPSILAVRRNGPVQIDGKIDEAAWQAATAITQFFQIDPNEGQPVSERTEARVLIDDAAIYVAVRSFDSDPKGIQSQLARRDEGIDGDLVELIIDSYHDHLTAFLFRLSPAGARRDAAITAGGNQDQSWDAVWEGRSSVDAEGWSAEFRVPLSQLRYNPGQSENTWGIQIGRKIARKAEVSVLAFTPKSQRGGVHAYGHITGLGDLPSPRRLELVPYALAKTQHPGVAENDPFRERNSLAPGAGLDVKYGITSNFTLDVTFNPDFGQVEVDPAVVNLSAFETFFPERRPFFVEGAGIFGFGGMRTNNSSNGYNFLHTRRIGRSPARSLGGSNFTFVDAPLETTIATAAKLTGRTKNGWSIGVLDALTLREEAQFLDASGNRGVATVEPQSNFFVGRVKRDMRGGNTTIGFAGTAVNRQLEPDLEPLFRKAAYTAGLDWNHAWGNRHWAFDGAVVYSYNAGSAAAIDVLQRSSARYLQRPDRESHHRDPTKTSLAGHVLEMTFARIAGEHWTGSLTYQDYSPGFEVNEAGFLGQTDMRGIAPLIAYNENKPGKYFRNWGQYLFWNPAWSYDGDLTFNGVGAITEAELPNFWNIFFRLDWRPPAFDPRLTRGGPVARIMRSQGTQFEIASDRRKKVTYSLYTSYYTNQSGGKSFNLNPRLSMRPSSALRVSLQPAYTKARGMAQFVTRVTDPLAADTYGSRYVFATLEQRQLSMVTRVDWTFSPTLSLQLFAQPLLASGDFVDYKEFAEPRQFEFDIYGRDAGTIARSNDGIYTVDPDAAGPAPSFTFGDRDFNQRSLRGNAVLRWEYRPGSALFFVWQQSRFGSERIGDFDVGRDFQELWSVHPENVFVIKATYWIGR